MANEKGKGTENFLIGVPLPNHASTYTVISHGDIIRKLENELNIEGLVIEERDYSYSYDGEIALGKVFIRDERDPDLGIAFTWINSYNKQVRFGCGIGGLIRENKAVMLGTEGTSWIRKHTGEANEEVYDIIEQLVQKIGNVFSQLIAEKDRMKLSIVDDEMFGRIMGALFFEHDLITPTQANAVKKEWTKSDVEYTDKNTLWGMYKILMFGIEMGDIKNWHRSQQKLHHMIMTEYAIAIDETPAHHLPLVPTQEELDAEHVGPPEMYLGDGIHTASINVSQTEDEDIEEVEMEEVFPTSAIQNRLEKLNQEEEEIEVEDAFLEENPNLAPFINVTVQLGYKREDAETYCKVLYDHTIANSMNLKAFRTWADSGKKLPEGTLKETVAEKFKVVGKEPPLLPVEEVIATEKVVVDTVIAKAFATIIEETVPTVEEFVKEVTKTVTKEPVTVIVEVSTVDIKEQFKFQALHTGTSVHLIDFFLENHFNEGLSLEESMEEFLLWSPRGPKDKPTVETLIVDEQPTIVLIEKEVEEVVEETVIETIIEEEVVEEVEYEVPSQSDEEMLSEMEEMSFDPNMEELVMGTIDEDDKIQMTMNTMFEEEEVSDNKELAGLFSTPAVNKAVENKVVEPIVQEIVDQIVVEETIIETVEEENPFALEEEEEEDMLEISDGLEPDEDVYAQAAIIEKRMNELYGSVRPYHHEEVGDYINVIIDESLERFAIPL